MTEQDISKTLQRNLDTVHLSTQTRAAIHRAASGAGAVRKKATRKTIIIVMTLLLALCGAAYAVYEGLTAELFGWFYGENWKQELQRGDQAVMGQSKQLGDAVYTIEEFVYKKDGQAQGLYGTIRIRPAENSSIILLASDFSVNQPAGYTLHREDEEIIENAKSYAELAMEQGAKIIMARASVKNISVNGKECLGDWGELWTPQQDGSIVGIVNITDSITRSEKYELVLLLSNWEVTPEGDHLREDPENTWLREEWQVTIRPEMKEEER